MAKAPGAPSVVAKPPVPGAKVEAGATTVPLAPKPPVAKPSGSGTAPMAKGAPTPGPTTSQLPKATVKLQQTTPMAKGPGIAAPPSAPVKRAAAVEEDYEEKDPEAGLVPLAVVCSVLAAAVMALSLLSTDKMGFAAADGESSGMMVPASNDPKWEEKQLDGTHISTFDKTLKAVTSKFE